VQKLNVFRSRFFWKLYTTYAVLVLATTAIVGVLVDKEMSRSLMADVATSLREKTILIGPYATRTLIHGLTSRTAREIERLGQEAGVRITLIRPDGTVVADSEQDPAAMDNHADREEVLAAADRPFGIARRYSHTLQQYMMYVAQALHENGTFAGTARTAVPLRAIDARLAKVRTTIAVGAILGVLVALVVGIVVARQITSPITEMTSAASAMSDGRYETRVRQMPADEIGVLGNSLNRLGTEITRRIATISHDQAQLRAIIGSMVEGVIAVDTRDKVLQCNRTAGWLLDLEPDRAPGRKLWELVRLPDLAELVAHARSEGEPVKREITVHRDGSDLILEAHAATFAVDRAAGLVIVLHDITNLRRLERIRRDFVANVSHELKTPLTSIKGYLETLLDGALYDETNNLRFLQKIEHHVIRLSDLVRDLLELARVESREETLPLVPIDWVPLIEETMRRHEGALERKGITCLLLGANTSMIVRGDRGAITQVADNLLDNAIKYTPPSGTVSIRLAAEASMGRLEVEDTGVGIPEQDQERIFERFYRVDKARSRDLGGTGLGLAIVKHCAQAMGGDVQVESRQGKGSRFIVRLPLAS
jgi:two-component system phosphate regulon sensor histidine kinase PhoR